MAFQTLLRQSKPIALRGIIDEAVIDVLQALDPKILSGEHLGELASQIIEPADALRDSNIRERVIRLLPLQKAQELAKRLDAKDGRSLYDNLCVAASVKSALPNLFSFFGVVQDPRAPKDLAPIVGNAIASYGLFDHQRNVARKVVRILSEQPHKTVLHMPTGSGKTRTAMHIIASHLKESEPTIICWLAQNAELLEQAADEFESAWNYLGNREVEIIRFWGNRNAYLMDVHDGLIVAGLGKMSSLDSRDPQTLLRLADRVSLTVIDEAHQAIAPTYQAVLTALYSKRPANALLGLTATPGRTWSDINEDIKLSNYFDGMKVMLEVEGYNDPVTFLIEQGYLARPVFKQLNSEASLRLSANNIKELSTSIDVSENLLKRLGTDTQRNLKIVSAVEDLVTRHKRIIVFAPSVANARILNAILSYKGIESHIVTGQTNTSERERIIRRFRGNANRTMVLVNYGVLTTGFDAPATSAAIIARPTRSLVLYSQMVGRATRGTRAGGNEEAEIITVIDPHLPGFGSVAAAFTNWEDVWNESD